MATIVQGLTREFVGISAYLAVNNARLINNFHFQSGDQAKPLPVANAALWCSILVHSLLALPALWVWVCLTQATCSVPCSVAALSLTGREGMQSCCDVCKCGQG